MTVFSATICLNIDDANFKLIKIC